MSRDLDGPARRTLSSPHRDSALLRGDDSLFPKDDGQPRTAQDLRSFVAAYSDAHPADVVRVTDPVSIEHDVMALVLEYERRHRYPILIFEKVDGYTIPIVANVVAS